MITENYVVIKDLKHYENKQKLKNSNPEAMRLLKEVFWRGTEDWDTLLSERAAISGQLVLSDFTKNAINSFKAK